MQTASLKRMRLILWGLVVIIGIGATILFVTRPPERPLGLFGGGFDLTTTDGAAFSEETLVGTPSLLFFGYTFCPDVCPTTLAQSAEWRTALGLSPDTLRIVFVTVDPARDTPETLAAYLSAFGAPIIGLTGTTEEIETAKAAFGVFSQKVDDGSSTEYLVDHTASVFMIGADGKFEGTISFGEDTSVALDKVRKLTGAS